MYSSKEVIKMKDISKTYDTGSTKFKALEDVNISIKKGEYVAIVGPSGAGKSTLMNIIGCLDTPTTGEYFLDGIDTRCSDAKLASIRNSKIGFIFQNYNLLPRISVLENVELPLHYLGIDNKVARERATLALRKMGLESHMRHKPTELSGGQKQRVAIARALVTTPQIILADEPTGALDSKTGKEVLKILKELNAEGNTIIMITHDKELALRAKRIITIMDGRVTSDIHNEQVMEEESL